MLYARVGICVIFLVFLALHGVLNAAEQPWQVADRLDLVPTPQQISLDGNEYSLDGWQIVVADDVMQARTGAREINDRIVKLGGAELPVTGRLGSANSILIAPCTHNLARRFARRAGVSAKNPGEQGYVVQVTRYKGKHLLLALGSDDLGALYACMTIRRMIQPRGGKPVLLGGKVRDWPAFKLRCIGKLGHWFSNRGLAGTAEEAEKNAQAYGEAERAHIQWLARHKINYAALKFVNYREKWKDVWEAREKCHRAVTDIAREYGIKARVTWGTAINSELKEGAWTRCVTRRDARFCWSATEEHMRNARKLAERSRRIGLGNYCLHVIDSGSMLDPEKWSERCDRCKKVYGNDHLRAATEQFLMYYNALRKELPDCEFEAVVYPYHFQWMVPGFADDALKFGASMPHIGWVRGLEDPAVARKAVAGLEAYHGGLARALPKDVLVTYREAGRAEFDGVCRAWKGHPVDLWVYFGRNKGWCSLWVPQQRFCKTWYRRGVRDMLQNAGVGRSGTVTEVLEASNAEYAWNLNVPDADDTFETIKRTYMSEGRNVTEYQKKSLIPRVCRRMWGESWEAFRDLFENAVSYRYVGDPKGVTGSFDAEKLEDPYMFLDEQTSVLLKAQEKINALMERVDAGKAKGVYGDLREEFGYSRALYLYCYTNFAAVKGEVDSAAVYARRLAAEGKMDEATRRVESVLARLPELTELMKRVNARVDRDPAVTWDRGKGSRKRVAWYLYQFSIASPKRRLENVLDEIRTAALFGTIPEHVKDMIANRTLKVAPEKFANPFKANAGRDEGGWTSTQEVEFFTTGGGKRLARFDTRVRLLWGKDALYGFAEMWDQEGLRPVARAKGKDGNVFEDDCFEIFLDVNGDRKTYHHFAVNAAGTKYDGHSARKAGRNAEWDAAARRAGNGWSAEFRIPWSELGATPKAGDTWFVNIARHRAAKPSSPYEENSSIIEAESNHTPEKFRKLEFARARVPNPVSAEIKLEKAKREDRTVTYGFATLLWLLPRVESVRVSRGAVVTVEVLHNGKSVAKVEKKIPLLSGLWMPPREIEMDLGQNLPGDLTIVVTATAKDRTLNATATFTLGPKGEIK